MTIDNTLYNRLNVDRNAKNSEIKKAYRKMSMKWHPDKNPKNKDEATKKFQEISEAYSILSDVEKRKKYDTLGMDYLKEGDQSFDPSDIFQQFFGEMGGMGGMGGIPGMGGFPFGFNNKNQTHKQKQENCFISKSVSLKDIYNEKKIKINYNQKIYCKSCDGTKSIHKKSIECPNCNGKGHVIRIVRMGPMIQQMTSECPNCRGTGEHIELKDLCKVCSGKGFKIKSKNITIPLRNGLKTGNKIKLENKGHYFKNGKTDLIIEIIELPDKVFKRNYDDLIIEVELKLYQALIGFNKVLKHMDDSNIYINNKTPIKDGDVKIIKGLGMSDLSSNKKGDLHLIFTVKYPELSTLSKEDSDLLKVLLAKTEKEELKLETEIFKNKSNFKQYKLEDFDENNYENNNSNEDHQQQTCVQQ